MKLSYAILFGLFGTSAIALPLQAQITIDGTTNTIIDNNGNSITINGGDRTGDNLFHSFEEFSVINGGEAFFNNAADISNIFSRVTGGNISNIDGLLKANGGANLFIINPAGIIFGEGASLDIGGSFFATTADSILFSDDIEFSAVDSDKPPLLTINQPIGLVLGDNAGAIVNQSVADDVGLQVSEGNNLTLVGGNIEFNGGTIIAPGANINLGGLSAAGEISIDADGSLNFPEDVARADVTLTNGTDINVQAGNGGNITVNANNIELSSGELEQSFLTAGIAPDSGSLDAQAGDITLNATEDINIADSVISNSIEELGIGNSGNINITATNLNLIEGGYIRANVFGSGNGGTIIINASDAVTLSGEDSFGSASIISGSIRESGEGNAGNIEITTTNLSLADGAWVTNDLEGTGNGGAIIINASDTITLSGEDSFGFGSLISNSLVGEEGNTGNIEITTTDLYLTEGGALSNTTFFGTGNSGAIIVKASNTIVIDGEDSFGFTSSISSLVGTEEESSTGNIEITSAKLFLTNGGDISTTVAGTGNSGTIIINVSDTIALSGEDSDGFSSSIISQVFGEGDVGDINITAANLSLTEGSSISGDTFAMGNAGAITIDVSDTIVIDGEDSTGFSSSITSRVLPGQAPEEEGNAGNINITTANLFLTNGAFIAADTSGVGDAGTITINASDTIALSGEGSDESSTAINAQVFGEGSAGSIDITTANLSLADGADISTGTDGIGNAGAIIIRASDTINIDGKDSLENPSGIFSRVEEDAVGEAAGIDIFTDSLLLTNGAEIAVDSEGQASAGNLLIEANSLSLDNSSLFASTPVGEGGRITLDIADNLILRNNSFISAQALDEANGGNVIIDADAIVAFPNQNNDIIAAAEQGRGGRINITTSAIFGLAEGNSTITNLTNDLDASSEFGVAGTVTISEIETNPAQGLEELPTEVIDVASLVAQNLCQQGEGSEFILTGKGGIAASPSQTRHSNLTSVDLVEPVIENEKLIGRSILRNASTETKPEIIEAQGWVVNSSGVLELVAQKTDVNSSSVQIKYDRICQQ